MLEKSIDIIDRNVTAVHYGMNPYMQAPRWQPRAAVPIARGGGSTTRMIVTWRTPRTITNHDERRLRRDKATSFKRQLHIHVRPSGDFCMRHASANGSHWLACTDSGHATHAHDQSCAQLYVRAGLAVCNNTRA